MLGRTVTATACANIALVKYWGKRDHALNLPARGSLSLTLDALTTETHVRFSDDLPADQMTLDGRLASASELARTTAWLDVVRQRAGIRRFAAIESRNHFPTASGLASSASGFAALAVAATAAAGWSASAAELSELARLGSGSAARSIFGGLVRLHQGVRDDGRDCVATPLASASSRDLANQLRMVICIVGGGAPKQYSSRDAMDHTAATSPLYPGWLACVDADLAAAEAAIERADLPALGAIVEANTLAMHASAMAARPAIVYWQPATLALLHQVRAMRHDGLAAWATMDAGPHVKVLTSMTDAAAVVSQLAQIPGVSQVLTAKAGVAPIVRVSDE